MTAKRIHKLRLGGYVRVSRVAGREGESFRSPVDQREAILAYAERKGHAVTAWAEDLDESGGREDRPGLLELIAQVEAGELDGIVVAYGSRLFRNTRAQLNLEHSFAELGASIHDAELDVDPATPAGAMVRTIRAAFAEQELAVHRERFDRLKRESTARGIWQRRQTPTGYSRDPETRRLVPNEDAPRVVAAFEARVGGASVLSISRDLSLTAAGVRALLRNRVYLGELTVGAYTNAAAHPALVSPELFDSCQTSKARPTRSKRATGPALLAGVMRCASCGHMMTRSGGGTHGTSYRCTIHHSGGRCPTPAAINAEAVEAYVAELVLDELERLEGKGTPRASTLAHLEEEARAAEDELQAYVTATEAVSIGAEAFAAGLEVRQARLNAATLALGEERKREGATAAARDAHEVWDEMLDGSGKNAIMRGYLEAVVVGSAGRGRRVPPAERVVAYRTGAGLDLVGRFGGKPCGLMPLPLDPEHPHALRVQPA